MTATAEAVNVRVRVGDTAEQHEYVCDLSDDCGCAVIRYRLTDDGWTEVES